jgi:Fe-S oxidoreductase
MRTEEALKTKPGMLSTSCPFCMTMFEDGIKDLNQEEECKVRDLAEIVAECLEPNLTET